jgi:hypothetical protein
MELSNFKLTRKKGTSAIDWEFIAEVDVTTGSLWWKKKERRQIRRVYGGSGWHFVDTGEFTPGFQAETLARAWSAQTGEQT